MNVLIFSTNETLAMYILRCLSVLGIRTCIMGLGKFHPIRISRYCDNYSRYEFADLLEENDYIVDNINNYCREQKLDIVIPAGTDGTLFISKISDRITAAKVFPLAKPETLKLLKNKWSFGEFIKKNGIPCPKTLLINDIHQLKSFNLEFPIVVKPLELEGGRGIAKLNSFKELEIYISKGNKFNLLPLLIQEYIPGTDMSINALAKNGKIVIWSIQKYQPNGHVQNIVEFIKDDNILNIGKHIVSCCNYTGMVNIDMRFDDRDKSIKVTECNPRFGTSTYMATFSGVNFPYLGLLMAQDKIIENINYREIRYLKFKKLIFETLKNVSLKDVNKHNLYFIMQVVDDPLYYGYSMHYYLFSILMKLLRLKK